VTIVTPPPAINRDHYGRPLVIPPTGGKPVAYTRATTYVDAIEDKIGLQKWMQRMTALGLASRPDLLLSVSAHRDDKKALDRICENAKEAAAASAAATTGTAIHALTELVDRGQDLPVLPDQAKADLAAYANATADLKAILIEQFCVLDTLKIGGTPDRVVEYGGERFIADVKTGSIEYGTLKIAAQLAVYARSQTYDIATGARGHHEADMTRGIIIHVPAGQGTATLHWVDLEAGWYAVQVAGQVRDKRRLKFKDLTSPFGPFERHQPGTVPGNTSMTRERAAADRDSQPAATSLEDRIKACGTADDVRALWEAHQDDWTDELTKTATMHIATLPAAS
jgi:hypothetical protein